MKPRDKKIKNASAPAPKSQRENSAGVIIYFLENNIPQYLLLHYPSGHWEFAKGHIEKGEKPEQAALREVYEETGISDIEIIPGFKEYAKYFFRKSYGLVGDDKKKAPWVFKLVTFYLAETKNKEVMISKEHQGFIWLPYDEAIKKARSKNAKMLLNKASNFIKNVSEKGVRGS